MTQTLMTLFCIEQQKGAAAASVSGRDLFCKVLEGHGGKLVSSAGAVFDIFLFDSPTEAVLAGIEILEGEDSRTEDPIRILVHTTEVTTSLSTLDRQILDVVIELLSLTAWGDLVIADSTYGSIKHSEVSRTFESTSCQLKSDKSSHQMYRIRFRAEEAGVQSDRQRRNSELRALRRGSKNAPYDRRALAFIFDYLLAIFCLGMVSVVNGIPEFWRVFTSRIIIEFEDFDGENARRDSSWKAYEGELVSLGYMGRLSKRVSVPKGNYMVDLVFNNASDKTNLSVEIGGFKAVLPISTPVRDRLMNSKSRLHENLPLEGDVDMVFKDPGNEAFMLGLDALILTPVGVGYNQRRESIYFYSANRYEDLLRILGCWDIYKSDAKYIFFFLIRCYPVWMLLNIIFLTFGTWTPGGFVLNLRTVTMKGERPGFVRALVRVVASFLGVFTFGFGWFKPLISHDERTWSDTWSHTRLIILE